MTLKCQMNRCDNRNCIAHTTNQVEDLIELEEPPKLFVPVVNKREIRPHSPTVDVVFQNQQRTAVKSLTDDLNWQGCRYD